MLTNVYVDGFNLYYNCLKGTPYKWLDIASFIAAEFPANKINRVRYFTARVQSRPSDPQQPDRQQAYIRALGTLPNLSIHLGQYKATKVLMPLVTPIRGHDRMQLVHKSEEKGSDVNIATYMLLDAFKKDCQAAIVITNDSDLTEPIWVARKELGIRVVVLHPCKPGFNPNVDLQRVSSFSRAVDTALFPAHQFAPALIDADGRTITKPTDW